MRNGKSVEMGSGDSKIMKSTHDANSTRKTKSGDRFEILAEEPQPKYRKLEKEKQNNQTEEKGMVGHKNIKKENTLPPERTQPHKLCTANFSSGTLKTLINRLLRLKNKIF